MGSNKYEYDRIGMNGRIDTIQAAILIEKLKIFKSELINRNKLAEYYKRQFLDLGTNIKLPKVISGATSSWAQFTIQLPLNCDRENFQIKMKEKGIPTAIYYPIPIHCQKPYKKFPISSDKLKNTNLLSKCVISLPMHAYLSFEDIEYISKVAHDIINN